MIQNRYVRLLAKRNRSMTVTQLSLNPYNATETSVSRITVVQRFNAGGLHARHPVVCVVVHLTANHKKDHLASVENNCLSQRMIGGGLSSVMSHYSVWTATLETCSLLELTRV
ncbi:hypothetical protein TNCV_2248711 [Trichonephila clavipes]|nr:hypothetical protein TNCV_2248711 [Trichonephila clavipes]